MKYLRKYNESFSDDLKEFCEIHLSYLMDLGFKVDITPKPWITTGEGNYYSLHKLSISKNGEFFSWNDIRDEFIPFYEMLKSNYDLLYIYDVNVSFTSDEKWAVKFNFGYTASKSSHCLLDSQLRTLDSDSKIVGSIDIIIKNNQ